MNGDEPKPKAVQMYCPRHLTDEAKSEWRRVSAELQRLGLLTLVDRAALSAYCQAWADWVEAVKETRKKGKVLTTDKGYEYLNPWMGIASKSLEIMHRFESEFGMTPASRTRLHVDPKDKKKSLAELLFEGSE